MCRHLIDDVLAAGRGAATLREHVVAVLVLPVRSFVRRDTFPNAVDQKVILTRSFLLADREITRAQFQQFVDDPDCPDEEKPKG